MCWHGGRSQGGAAAALQGICRERGRQGLEKSPWEALQEQVVLGGAEFLAELREHVRGDAPEQRGARRLVEARPRLAAVIAAVERVKGKKWDQFRERHGMAGGTWCCIWDDGRAD